MPKLAVIQIFCVHSFSVEINNNTSKIIFAAMPDFWMSHVDVLKLLFMF
jgi:hypothetical protein